jgi:hypothetical protein
MSLVQKLEQNIEDIIDIAKLAPSVHNTQPWKVKLNNEEILIRIDDSIDLTYSDPTGRETYISLGIFTEAVALTALSFGFGNYKIIASKNEAKIEFKDGNPKTDDSKSLIEALKTRCTDRSIFTPFNITKTMVDKIQQSIAIPGVKIRVLTTKSVVDKMADLTSRGISLALSSPDFRKELSGYLATPLSGKKRGISTKSLRIPALIAMVEPFLIKHGVNLGAEARLEKKRWLSASAIVFITTNGDLKDDWFNAGRAYLRSALTVESLGLSQATSAATVEASTFHEDVEAMLHTKQRLQCTTRIGKGSKRKVFSPREPAKVFIAT